MYKVEQINENTIKLTKLNINKDDYEEKILNDDEILLIKKNKITLTGFFEFNTFRNKYSFNNSKILSCSINKSNEFKLKYKPILNYIYSDIIKDGTKIIKNSILNISTIEKNIEGFYYIKDLGISIQGADANKCLYEIINQCSLNTINIKILIELIDRTRIEIILNFDNRLLCN